MNMVDDDDDRAFKEYFEVSEAKLARLKELPSYATNLTISGDSNGKTSFEILAKNLSKLRNIDNIKGLEICFDSSLEDLHILKFFKNLETLSVTALGLKTFSGLEHRTHLEYLRINTSRRTKRDLSDITAIPIKNLNLRWAKTTDLQYIFKNRHIESIDVFNCKEWPNQEWIAPIHSIKVAQSVCPSIANLSGLKKLKHLYILSCKRLEELGERNNSVKHLYLSRCPRLPLSQLKNFPKLQSLTVVSQKVNLAELTEHPNLKDILLNDCQITPQKPQKLDFPNLKTLLVFGSKEFSIKGFQELNPEIAISDNYLD